MRLERSERNVCERNAASCPDLQRQFLRRRHDVGRGDVVERRVQFDGAQQAELDVVRQRVVALGNVRHALRRVARGSVRRRQRLERVAQLLQRSATDSYVRKYGHFSVVMLHCSNEIHNCCRVLQWQ